MISICAKYMAPAFREARSRDEILSSFHVQNTSQRARTGEILDGVHVGNVLRSETRLWSGETLYGVSWERMPSHHANRYIPLPRRLESK
jgi:hypothetical protein